MSSVKDMKDIKAWLLLYITYSPTYVCCSKHKEPLFERDPNKRPNSDLNPMVLHTFLSQGQAQSPMVGKGFSFPLLLLERTVLITSAHS